MGEVRRIDIEEFIEEGFLQEANRLFFHPLGLALEAVRGEDGRYVLGGVWDYRDDPEGMFFKDLAHPEDKRKRDKVSQLRNSLSQRRMNVLGINSTIQPIGHRFEDEEIENGEEVGR